MEMLEIFGAYARTNCHRTSSTANFQKPRIGPHGGFWSGRSNRNAPFTLRNAVWIYDAHLDRASSRILANCKALSSSVASIDAEANEWERYLEARGHAGETD